MSHRTFADPAGKEWDVWFVSPNALLSSDLFAPADVDWTLPLDSIFRMGWLCFESRDGEKRRLAPVPENWENASIGELLRMRDEAAAVARKGIPENRLDVSEQPTRAQELSQ